MRYPEVNGRWSKPILDFFLARIELIPFTDCWIWIGNNGEPTNPYGVIQIQKANVLAHRWSYSHFIGDIGEGLEVLHRCDTHLCVNPAHLFTGTQSENLQDMRNKGRAVFFDGPKPGVLNPQSKFTEDQIRAIRKDSRTHDIIAKGYGVWQSTISLIKNYKTYKEVVD